jgi:hypothetical protein
MQQSRRTVVNYNPTYELDSDEVKRQQDRDRRELERRLRRLENAFNGGGP